jgi:hypothetical protein
MKAKALGIQFVRQYVPKRVPVIPKPNIGIYKIEWSTGHFYIGRSTNIRQRIAEHKRFNKRPDLGEFVHSILHYCVKEDLAYFESKYISESINNPLCLNKQVPRA